MVATLVRRLATDIRTQSSASSPRLGARHGLFDAREHARARGVQVLCEAHDGAQRGGFLAALEHADVGAVVPAAKPELFLGYPQSLPQFAQDPAARAHGPTEIAFLAGDAPDGGMAERQVLLAEVFVLRYQMIAVATGKVGLNEVDDYYRVRRRRVHEGLVSLGLDDPNPFPSLWDWYRHWKATFNSYAERRRYVKDLYSSLVERLSAPAGEVAVVPRELTGWERVDRSLRKAQDQLARARDEEDFQAIGLLCRELLISVAQAVYDPTCHASADGVMPSSTDAKRMIAAFLDATVPGSSNETLRRAVRSAVELAVELQHRRTAAFRDAALCMETASSIVNMLAILAGKRDPVV